jgi:ATP-dependent helicase HepA
MRMGQDRDESFQPGDFVRLCAGEYRLGKVVRPDGPAYLVEHFVSIAQRQCARYAADQLSRAYLAPQTRCYVQVDGAWQMGRIGQRSDNQYEVIFPDRAAYVAEGDIFVRTPGIRGDPLDVLILRGQETPYFHDHRLPFVREMVQERAIASGLSGLISSSIDIYPHQVNVVRRVLEDPVQRYLLADEVGLGKTIEAGVIIRQLLADRDDIHVLVLVPDALDSQWRLELSNRFAVEDFLSSEVEVVATSQFDKLDSHRVYDLVVIDEAHNVASTAYESSEVARERWSRVRELALCARRLLLLSGTPILGAEREFLAMLHLLDPYTHRLDDIEGFQHRVRDRQRIGQLLLTIQPGASTMEVEYILDDLATVFPQDGDLSQLASELRDKAAAGDVSGQDRALLTIRAWISDRYRLHRRLIRSRRTDTDEYYSGARACRWDPDDPLPEGTELAVDSRCAGLWEAIDVWRQRALDSLDATTHDKPGEDELSEIFAALCQCAGADFEAVRQFVAVRRGQQEGGPLDPVLGPEAAARLAVAPRFAGEIDALDDLLQIVETQDEHRDHAWLAAEAVALVMRAARKKTVARIVAFCSYPPLARRLTALLARTLGAEVVRAHGSWMSLEDREAALAKFRMSRGPAVLVCDSSAEEGCNIQAGNWLLHIDLPWNPARIEQRTGRLDRIGQVQSIRTRLILNDGDEHGILAAWARVLGVGLGVFTSSIASLQYYTTSLLPTVRRAALRNGASGLDALVQVVQQAKADELRRNREQDILDGVDSLLRPDEQPLNEVILAHDRDYKATQRAVESWIVECLQFRRGTREEAPEVVSYRATEKTLLPQTQKTEFRTLHNRPLVYSRAKACQTPDARLVRIGDPLIDGILRLVRFDDRGQAFALWRCFPATHVLARYEWTGFQFTFIVEADLRPAFEVLARDTLALGRVRALRRRGDGLLPPELITVFVDLEGHQVRDTSLLQALEQPYTKRARGGCDVSLTHERALLISDVIDASRWPDACRAGRAAAERIVLDDPARQRRWAQRTTVAEREWALRRAALLWTREQRQLVAEAFDLPLSTEIALEESLVRGVESPHMQLDSVGFIVLSSRLEELLRKA